MSERHDDAMPIDLPHVVDYLMHSGIVLPSLPRRPVSTKGSSRETDKAIVRPTIPLGAKAWRAHPDNPWRPLSEIPDAWMPFLNRSKYL